MAASSSDPAYFLRDYEMRLHALQRNEKRDITALTVLAGEHRQHAQAVVGAVLRHIQAVRSATGRSHG